MSRVCYAATSRTVAAALEFLLPGLDSAHPSNQGIRRFHYAEWRDLVRAHSGFRRGHGATKGAFVHLGGHFAEQMTGLSAQLAP